MLRCCGPVWEAHNRSKLQVSKQGGYKQPQRHFSKMFTAAAFFCCCWFQHEGIWSQAFHRHQKWRDLVWCHRQPTLSCFKGVVWTEITGLLTHLFCAAVNMLILLHVDPRETDLYSFTHLPIFTHVTNIICCFDNICSVFKHYKSEWFSNKKPFTEPFQNQLWDLFSFFSLLMSDWCWGAFVVWLLFKLHKWDNFLKNASTRTFHYFTQFFLLFPLYHCVAHFVARCYA